MIASRGFLLAAMSIAALAANAEPVHACSCTEPPTFEQSVSWSKQIFRGTAVDVRSAAPEYPSMVWARFVVTQSWKGAPDDTASVLTGENSGVCGCEFTPGGDYLIYAFLYMSHENPPFTHLCSRTHETWAGDPDIAALNEITPVVPRTWGALKLLYR